MAGNVRRKGDEGGRGAKGNGKSSRWISTVRAGKGGAKGVRVVFAIPSASPSPNASQTSAEILRH